MIELSVDLPDANLMLGLVLAEGIEIGPATEEFDPLIAPLVTEFSAESFEFPARYKTGIRKLLKRGGFKAAGRNKPASEYLVQAIRRDAAFPRINNAVDINNYISARSFLPASIVDADAVGPRAMVRYGREGESFVFNPSGHEISLKGLLSLCAIRDDGNSEPLANPVKDSMVGKLKPETARVLAVIYASLECIDQETLFKHTLHYAEMLKIHCGATSCETNLLLAR